MNFDAAFEKVIQYEGGYSAHPMDPGGATNYGITIAVARENGYTGDMRDLSLETAKTIYRKRYWDAIKADSLPFDLRFHVFDAAVNSGITQAVRWLQRAVNVGADGIVGPITIAAAHHAPGDITAARMTGYRLAFMTSLKTWPTFGAGWAKRIANNLMEE